MGGSIGSKNSLNLLMLDAPAHWNIIFIKFLLWFSGTESIESHKSEFGEENKVLRGTD